jgi:mannose-6-phosphate isomerase-like protein (cupin superfamily)
MPVKDDLVLPSDAGRSVTLASLGVRFMLDGAQTGGRFALVEHPLPPRSLGSPVHTHQDEDEFSFILEGEVGIQIGNRVLSAGPGTLVAKPRGVPHAFWNAGDAHARLLEFISPAGFEHYFEAMAELYASGAPDPQRAREVQRRFHLDMDLASIPGLMATYRLTR